ncbi:hypothetical protein MTR67_001118 [Solanum verrucosum]|uniref:Cytochrome P450 n=1 Tax=Solanum verrucosum TaxID=315347 RepID=A0AAF0T849_SOLVR|nr:hypothetical protein MTR67_001118 [Solanum verrucosum]
MRLTEISNSKEDRFIYPKERTGNGNKKGDELHHTKTQIRAAIKKSEQSIELEHRNRLLTLTPCGIFSAAGSNCRFCCTVDEDINSFPSILTREGEEITYGSSGIACVAAAVSYVAAIHSYCCFDVLVFAEEEGEHRLWLGKKLGIIITSHALAREVLKDKDIIFANKDVPAAGRENSYGGNDILWNPYTPKWRMLRKVCVRDMLNCSALDSAYSLRRRELRQSINYLYSQKGLPVNVGEQNFLNVLNVITSMLWGGTVKGEERASVGAEFRHVVTEMAELVSIPNLSDFYPGLACFDFQGVVKKMKVLVKRFDKIFDNMIDQRQKLDRNGVGQESKDVLQVLLKLKDEADAKMPLTMIELKALLMDMIVGGTGSTASTVEFVIAEIMHKPDVLRKLQLELDIVVGKDNIVEESHIQQLPYLYAVMKEVLRIHPAIPLLAPHCPSETCTVGGYVVPKGSCVFINKNMCGDCHGREDVHVFIGFAHSFFRLEIARRRDIRPYREVWQCFEEENASSGYTYSKIV